MSENSGGIWKESQCEQTSEETDTLYIMLVGIKTNGTFFKST